MRLLAAFLLGCVFFCGANCFLSTKTASRTSPHSIPQQSNGSGPPSSTQRPSSSRNLSSTSVISSNPQRSSSTQVSPLLFGNSTSSLANYTKKTSLRTGKDTAKLAAYGNSSSPLNKTLTYNIWTIDSEDPAGNLVIWENLTRHGVDESDIDVLGLPPGLSSMDCFQVVMSTEKYKEIIIEVRV